MMNILVITATDAEFDEAVTLQRDFLYHTRKSVDVMKGGIGKTEMAYTLTKRLCEKRYDYLINMGVAGSLKKDLKPFDTVFATKVAYYDFDLTAFGNARGQTDGNPLYFEADAEARFITKHFISGVRLGTIVSGDRFVTNKNKPTRLKMDFDHPIAIDMESAVIGHIAYLEQIPFVVIRTISDSVESNVDDEEYESKKAKSA